MQKDWIILGEKTISVADKNLGMILCTFTTNISIPEGDNGKYFSFCKEISIPILDPKIIAMIITIPTNKSTILERLSPIAPFFKFDSKLLTSFLDSICSESIKITYSLNILSYFVISWLSCPNLEENIQSFNELILAIYQFRSVLKPQLYHYMTSSVTERFFDCGILPFPNSLVKKIFTEVNEYNFDLTVSVLNNMVVNNDEDSILYLVNLINFNVTNAPDKFAKFDFQILVSTLYKYVCEFNETALHILATLSIVKKDQSLLDTVSDIPAILLNKIKPDYVPKITPKESKLTELDLYTKVTDVIFNVSLNDTFPNGLNPLPPSHYESKEVSFNTLISVENQKLIKNISEFLSRATDVYIDAFFNSLNERVTEDSFPIFLCILVNLRVVKITDGIFEKLLLAFKPGVNVFSQSSDFGIVNFYRKSVLGILSMNSPSYVSKLLIVNENHPFLFADIIGRIHIKLSHYNISYLVDDSTLATVIRVLSTLSSFNNEGIEEIASKQALSGIFLYFFTILENKKAAAKCFVSPVFASGFLSKVLEPSLKKLIIDALHSFLAEFTITNTKVLMPLTEFICGIFGVFRKLPKEENLVNTVIDILSCINDSIIHNNTLSNVFSSVIVPATNFLIEQPSKKLLNEVLCLCSLLIDYATSATAYSITQEEAVLLSAATRASESDIISELTISRLLNIISSSTAATMKAMFIIRQPIMINVLMSALKNEDQIKDVITLFDKLCHHSLYNCRACHEGEFDLLMLEMIKNGGKEFCFRGMTFTLAVSPETINNIVLPLVTFIATYISSPQIAMALISIIKPLKDRHFSEFAENTMKAIGSSLVISSKLPKSVVSIGDTKTYVDISGVKASHINKGFTVQFWLQIDTPAALLSHQIPTIFSIKDMHGVELRLQVSGNTIVCYIHQESEISTAVISSNIETEKWILYTLVVRFNEKSSRFTFTSEGIEDPPFSIDLTGFNDDTITFQIGGVAPGNEGQPFECRLGEFWFFAEPLLRRQIAELNNIGARASDIGVLALFSYPVTVIASGIKVTPHISKQSHLQSIQEILCSKVFDFVPFFSFLDTMPQHFLDQLIDLLQSIIEIKETETKNLFSMISVLLMNTPHSKLTYNLYLKFFGIIENCSNTELIKDLTKSILFNPELWCVCKASHLQRIVAHWSSALFSIIPSIFMSVVSISDVLVIMRLYFWYSPIETEIIHGMENSERPRPPSLDVEICRTNLCKLIFSMALFKFQTRDAISIVSHCSTCSETKQIINMMNLLIDIAKTRDHFTFPINISRLVYHQLKPQPEERFIAAVKLLYSLGEADFFKHHIQCILSLLNDTYNTKKLYDAMLEALPEYHLLFPICSLLAVSLDIADDFAAVLDTIEITNEEADIIVQNEIWAIWLLILVIHGSDRSAKVVSKLIIDIVFVKPQMPIFDDIFILIDFFAAVTDYEIEQFGRNLATKIAKRIIESGDMRLGHSFAKRCIKYLFFRVNGTETSDAINAAFEETPYSLCDVSASSSQVLKLATLKSFKEIKNVFEKELPLKNYFFMFRLKDDGTILDKSLFDVTVQLLEILPHLEEDLKFFHKFFLYMKDHSQCSQSFAQEINQMMNSFYISKNKLFLSAVQSFKKAIYRDLVDGETKCLDSFHSLQVKEIGLASNDIDLFKQFLNISKQISSRLIRKMAKNNINSSAPWSTICRASGSSKSFVFCESFSQPLLKFNYLYNTTFESKLKRIDSRTIHSFQVTHVRIKGNKKAVVNIYSDSLQIYESEKFININYADIRSVLLRNRLHKTNSLEFILMNGKSYLIDFTPTPLSEILLLLMRFPIKVLQSVSHQNFFTNTLFTQKWVNGEISNFEYLMFLNTFTGRTFHDAALYPIFPWIITDYESKELSLTSEKTFRDLSKPVTNQKESMFMLAPMNPSCVKHFLKNIHPFECIEEMEPKFSLGELKSIKETYQKIVNGSNTIEVPPEFYYSPEYFEEVELPPWCKSNYEFVYLNRVALESDYVSEHLNLWIDLIFGCKSRGDDKNNAFNPVLYEDVWWHSKEADKETIEATLKAAGQMPSMIFTTPHPKKNIPKESILTITDQINHSFERNDIIHITLMSYNQNSLVYCAVCENGGIVRFNVNLNNPQKSSMFTFDKKVENPSASAIIPLKNGAVIIDPTTGTLFSITEKIVKEQSIDISSNTVFVDSDGDTLVFSSPEGVICSWRKESNAKIVCNVFKDYITSVAYNKDYSLITVGTRNGFVIANTMNGSSVFSTKVGSAPSKILVTKLWCFVLAFLPMQGRIVLLSVNGKIIWDKKVNFLVSSWCTWEKKGKEYVCIADEKGKLRLFDIITGDLNNVIFNFRCLVTSVNFIKKEEVFSVSTNDGQCRVIPRSVFNTFK